MSTNPLFLQRFNLDESADERAIRRAYARELKLIDQERNPAEFQELRELYEAALHWARGKIALMNAVVVDEPATAVLAPEPVPADDVAVVVAHKAAQQEDADAVIVVDHEKIYQELEDFRLYCDGMRRREEHSGDLIMWQEKLNEILARPEFDNLHARGVFEANIIYRLVSGWKPGHETLFVAAAKIFRWREEPSRLRVFGEGGAVIDLAVLQYLMFEDLRGSPQYPYFRKAVARLRIGKAPAFSELMELYPYMDALAQNYPTWLGVITDVQRLEVWQKKDAEIPAWRRKYCNLNALKRISIFPKRIANWHWSAKVFLCYIVVIVVINIFSPGSPRTVVRHSPSSAQTPVGNESQPRIPGSAELARQGTPATGTSLPEIVRVKPIYPELSLLRKEEGQVMIRVAINELGKADNVDVAKSSGFPLLDDAAVEAVKKGSFKPYIVSGTPKASIATLPVSFSLADYRK